MRREDAQAFVQSHLRPENGVAVVYGDIDPGEVKTLAEKYLAAGPPAPGAAR